MKPFNLQEALTGKAVKLRNGEKAFVRHHETEQCIETDEVLLGYRVGVCSWSWCIDGASSPTRDKSPFDIIGMYPETKMINGFEVPAPETEELEYDTLYYLASTEAKNFRTCAYWDDHDMDKLWLGRGLVFLNKEDAIAATKAMLGIDPNLGEDKE